MSLQIVSKLLIMTFLLGEMRLTYSQANEPRLGASGSSQVIEAGLGNTSSSQQQENQNNNSSKVKLGKECLPQVFRLQNMVDVSCLNSLR